MPQKNFLHTPTPPQSSWLVLALLFATFATTASAATRPHYGGTLRVLLQSAPETLDFPANPTPTSYWDAARTLSLIGDTLVKLDALDRPQPALAVVWQSDLSGRICLFTLRRGVKFHDGTVATPAAIAACSGPREGQRVSRTTSHAIGASIATDSNRAWNSLKLAPSWLKPR